MFSIFFLARLFAQEFSGVLDGVMVFIVLDAILEILRVMEDISMVLKDTFVNLVREPFNDKTGTIFHYSRLSLREWFMLILLFLGLHNSSLGLSWLLNRSPITIFKALRRIMLKLKAGRV
jgi:hypothetical protein